MTDTISPDLKAILKRLKLSPLLSTLPERLALARQQKIPHQDFLLTLLSDEVSRRDSISAQLRGQKARLDPEHQLEGWDSTTQVHFDQELWAELCSLRFVEARAHVALVGPVGVGKTFLAHALGNAACRRQYSVLAYRCDRLLKNLRHARLDGSYDAELRKILAVDVLILDDFGLDAMDATESRDAYEIFTERHRHGSIIVTSNRGPDEWLAIFADPVSAQAAIDRFTSNAYDLVIEGESYRRRQKPTLDAPPSGAAQERRRRTRTRTR
jgi:DNA replication protein DnaC